MNTQPRILVVDDTPANAKLLVDVLAAKGYAMSSAVDGEDALAKIAEHAPDIVLLDIMMPGLSGYEVCRRIRADPSTALLPVVLCTSLNAHEERINGIEAFERIRADADTAAIPVVAFTASVTPTDRNRITQAGFSGFVSKPIQLKEFLATVKRMLEGGA